MFRYLLTVLLYLPAVCLAQFTYVQDQGIPVRDLNNKLIGNPWAGGLNAAQYNTMDLDNDGLEDLVLFDRMANKVITFVNISNTSYKYSPDFEKLFPAEITNWLLLRDYNCDGKKDIFTGDILGIKVFTNTYNGSQLTWEKYLFDTGGPQKSEVLITEGSAKVNLQLGFDDLPAIIDADGDGDLDIFNFRYPGGGAVDFHENVSNNCNVLTFKRVTRTWGNFSECQCGIFAFNGESCAPGGRIEHASGKSLLVFDADGDGDLDIVMSEAECFRLYLLNNTGTAQAPAITSSTDFPANSPANFYIFPGAFYEDVDFDGVKDIIATPNIYSKEFINTNLQQSNWFYKNNGTNTSPSFTFIKSNFLQDDMIDVGDQSVPTLIDYDGDGDLDLLISRSASENLTSSIYLYENTGTKDLPDFKLVTEDYLRFSLLNYYNLKIQFADIDKDNTTDLVFTGTDLSTGSTRLYYVPNKSADKADFSGQSVHPVNFSLSFSENLFVIDVNTDGLPDLLVGRSNGTIEYWKNTGIASAPSFTLENASFLGFSSSVNRQNMAISSGDLNADGKTDLVLGDQTGVINIVSDFRNRGDNAEPMHEIIFNKRLASYTDANLGGRIWPVVANLFNANQPALVVGNILGGIQILKNDEGKSLASKPVIEVYPNPVASSEILKIRADRPVTVQIFSLLGALMEPKQIEANEIHEFKLPNLAAGLYLLRFTSHGKTTTKELVIH
ncbi:T9SS type A sorting domain-containing protein [Chryseosolibacter indicus]|uniref:T9SS type A sorting domain-containing protein n=1 Tax=Chryseosolibacter indicus TaxID=2782351 RepID=A0ABS5VME3_9BACT|nr:T9SS type A sorting domain-containing protein [Chryseosolibacter indicus]MBT1702618.1 T9SS type A sorting domain-containing protein [Chryseosolibacter indicus]